MSLELSPQTQSRIIEYAAAAGVNVDEYINRLLERAAPKKAPAQPTPYPVFTDKSDDDKRAAVLAYINLPPEEIARRHAPGIAYLQAQLDVAANASPEEIAQADAEWEAHKQAMNENRRITGERLLYPDGPQR